MKKAIIIERKGKSFEEIFGVEKAKEMKRKLSIFVSRDISNPVCNHCDVVFKNKPNLASHLSWVNPEIRKERITKIRAKTKDAMSDPIIRAKISRTFIRKGNTPPNKDKVGLYRHTIEDKEIIKQLYHKRVCNECGKVKGKEGHKCVGETKIEIKIQTYLKELGIEFFTHEYIKEIRHSYQCDIFIPSLNMVIECDGDYWHKYPTGTELDHIRTKELIEKGFKVLRLWEREINKMSVEDFKNRIVS